MPTKEAFGAIERIARAVAVPVTGDIEAGYQLTAEEAVEALITSGAVGCNIEDSDHHTELELTPIDSQVAYLEAMRSASSGLGVDLVINARVDVFRSRGPAPREMFEEGVQRATAYVQAGADCVYPIRLNDEDLIGEFIQKVQAPVNIMFKPSGPSVARLAELGVARISLAGGLMQHAYAAAHERLKELQEELAGLP
jgi:2-methylisocitrate lyase-like PEP mutase family enzyme